MHNANRKRRRIASSTALAIAVVSVIAALPAAAAPAAGTGDARADAVRVLKLSGISPAIQPGILHIWIGRKLGYYRQQNLDVEYQPSAGATDAIQRLSAGNVDLAIGTTDSLFAAQAQNVPLPFKMFYQYSVKTPYQIAVANGSSINTLADLKGKTIGVVSFAETGYFYSRAVLAISGVDPFRDVKFVALGQGPALLNALRTGQIDAIAAFRQLYAIFRNQGYSVKLVPHPDKRIANIGNVGILAPDSAFRNKAKRKDLVGYGIALAKSTIFAMENPDAACRIYFSEYPETLSPSRSYSENVADCKRVWAVGISVNNPKAVGHKRFGVIDSSTWKRYTKILGLQNKVEIDKLYTNGLIGEINARINEPEVRRQARNFCNLPANRELCEKS